MASIRLSAITKSFGDTQVLKGIDLAIEPGEFLTLVGPSGCGKSTLLRILAGLEAQSAGDVIIGGETINKVRAAERNLAMVFQSYALYPHMSVLQNMMTPLTLRDLSFRERLPFVGPLMAVGKYRALKERVAETAKILQIEDLLHRKPGQLSGGQRQRAALGRAMVRNPVAFLMDEPLSNLDAALRVHMRAELAELHRRLGTTFVYVTHDQAEALTMSDRMAVMMGGEILQLDSPDRVYSDPQDLRVASFVGSPKINCLPAEVDQEGRLSCLGLFLERRVLPQSDPKTVAIRPEHLVLISQDGQSRPSLSGTVTHKENLGAEVFLHLALADGAHRMILRAEAEQVHDTSLLSRIDIAFRPGRALIFGAKGERLRFLPERQEKAA